MNVLEIIQTCQARLGLRQATSLFGISDQNTITMVALLGTILEDLSSSSRSLSVLRKDGSFLSRAEEFQLDLQTLEGFSHIISGTLFNKTTRVRLMGPLSPAEWQAFKVLPTAGPFFRYYIQGEKLYFLPKMPAGHTIIFSYQTRFLVKEATGTKTKPYPTVENDLFIIPDVILLSGLLWLWRSSMGLTYAEEQRFYEEQIRDYKSAEGTTPTLYLDGGSPSIQPGIFVPAGSWNVPL